MFPVHDDVIKWKHFPRNWPFVRGIHRSQVNSPHKGQRRGAVMFSLIYVWINGWVNNGEAGDLRRHGAHYDVTVMVSFRKDVIYRCPVPGRGKYNIPYAVSLVVNKCDHPKSTLYISQPHMKRPMINFTVCMTPLLGNSHRIQMQIIEMIETNRLFGAQTFIFYNLSSLPGTPVTKAIEYYIETGLVTTVQWPWPFEIHSATIHNGQTLAEWDCFLRSLYSCIYITYIDIDEVLVPRSVPTWGHLFSLPQYQTSCGLLFRNAFFYTRKRNDGAFISDPIAKSPNHTIQVLLKTRRNKHIWEAGKRSKYIVMVRKLEQPKIHWGKCVSGNLNVLPVSEGLLHHYRHILNWDHNHHGYVKDRFMHRHNGTIKARYKRVLSSLGIL